MSRHRALAFVALITLVGLLILLFATTQLLWLRVLFGIPFVLLLPGQAVLLMLDPDGQLGGFEWFTLSVGTSIAITMLIGIGLAVTVGLTAAGLALALTAVIFMAIFVANAKTASLSEGGPTPTGHNSIQRATFATAALVGCLLLVLLLSIPTPDTGRALDVVQLWGLPDQTSGDLRIGVNNVNASSQHYRLAIRQGDRLISEQVLDIPAGSNRIFVVKKSATWTNSSPVIAVLTDPSGLVSPRTISVWVAQ